MDSLRRGFEYFFASGIDNAIHMATRDDTSSVDDAYFQEVLLALLGGTKKKTPADTMRALSEVWEANWNWSVLLKALLFLQYVLDSSSTTLSWLQYFLADLSILQRSAGFSDTETPQSASHSHILRLYSIFLQLYCQELLDPDSPHNKHQNLHGLSSRFDEVSVDWLLSKLCISQRLLTLCMKIFVSNGTFRFPHGFTDLTAQIARTVLQKSLKLYGVINMEIIALLDRLVILHARRLSDLVSMYKIFLAQSVDLIAFCETVRTFPRLDFSVPRLSLPEESTLDLLGQKLELEGHVATSSPSAFHLEGTKTFDRLSSDLNDPNKITSAPSAPQRSTSESEWGKISRDHFASVERTFGSRKNSLCTNQSTVRIPGAQMAKKNEFQQGATRSLIEAEASAKKTNQNLGRRLSSPVNTLVSVTTERSGSFSSFSSGSDVSLEKGKYSAGFVTHLGSAGLSSAQQSRKPLPRKSPAPPRRILGQQFHMDCDEADGCSEL